MGRVQRCVTGGGFAHGGLAIAALENVLVALRMRDPVNIMCHDGRGLLETLADSW
jgi:hypothetical protein